MKPIRLAVLAMIAMSLSNLADAQRLRSPEVNDDGTVTFRFQSGTAKSVRVKIERAESGEYDLIRDDKGVWSVTTNELAPKIYEYRLIVDGVSQLDPRNRWVKKWYSLNSLFEIPGERPLVTERQSVPHGTLHHHLYASSVTGGDRAAIIYTPPGYAKNPDRVYPVLFLLHGFGDDQTAWTEVGRANLIADNLIARGEITEMIIVMPHGHPVPLPYGQRPKDYGTKNDTAIAKDIVEVLLPFVEKNYRVGQDKEALPGKTSSLEAERAIVGLSMGGGHALKTGLAHPDIFSYVGAFSAAAPQGEPADELIGELEKSSRGHKRIWIACGENDFLLDRNREFAGKLTSAEILHDYVETQGAHNWDVWRDNYLPQFLRMVFR